MFDPTAIDVPLPKGVADFLPEQAAKIDYIESRVSRVFEQWGFQRIIPPLLEYQDVLAMGMGDELKERMFRFEDRHTNRLVAVPPDITPQVARIEATRMRGYPLPHRLYYVGRVLRHAELQSGKSRELRQAGVELIGLESPEADAEMVGMAVEVLRSLGLSGFKIDLGQVAFGRGVLDSAGVSGLVRRRLEAALAKKDSSAIRELLDAEKLPAAAREEILALPRLLGGPEIVAEARRVVRNERSLKALDTLATVLEILDIYGVSEHLAIDLGEMRGFTYHSGLTFEGFVTGLGEAVCSGGRYDDLMGLYGTPAPATGFAFNILALLAALQSRPDVEASTTRDFLVFNRQEDRREALAIASKLRALGYSAARDIIRRDFADSLAYAKRMHILQMLVIGGEWCADDEVYIVRVADGTGRRLKKQEFFAQDGPLKLDA
jgi:ATP phosphoribosyltransferase regulatory subunit